MPALGRIALLLALFATLAACPGRTRRQLGGEPPIPEDGDARARQRFEETRARFRRDGATAADFAAIAREFPDDPIAPHARLYAGVASLEAGDHRGAVGALEEVVDDPGASPEVRRRGQLFLGIALGYRGEHERAVAALTAGKDAVDPASRDEQASFHAAMAAAHAELGRAGPAIRHYDAWYPVGRLAEQAYAVAQIRALTAALDRRTAEALFEEVAGRKGPAAALVGERLAGLLAAAGDGERADEVRRKSGEARSALGMVREGGSGSGGDSGRVGAVLSLSGKRNRIGDVSLRGLALAAGAGGDASGSLFPRPFSLEVEDDGGGAAAAASAIDRLAADDVIAVVGPIDVRSVEQAAVRAAVLGLPLLSLTPAVELLAPSATAPSVFHVVHSAEQRAQALARHALASGARDFAILRPDSRFGAEVARAFAAQVRAGGGQVVVEHAYPAGATAFTSHVAQLKKPWQALFVADGAAALELIAPALAAGNLLARPPGEKVKTGRAIQLYALGDQVKPRFLRAAGRYAHGAVLAPGFYPDPADPAVAEFAEAYQRAFGSAPTALEAYAFDAALLVRRAVEAGARNRGEVADWLAGARVRGLTGDIAFDASRRRGDAGVLYRVDRVAAEQYELRPAR
jgi:ABC-type branched-subunit amino acid transport system substrate-binding protein